MFSCPVDGWAFINIFLKCLLLDKLGFTEVNSKPLSDLTLHTLQMSLIIKPEHQWCSHLKKASKKKKKKKSLVHTNWEAALSKPPAAQAWTLRTRAATAPGLYSRSATPLILLVPLPSPIPCSLSFPPHKYEERIPSPCWANDSCQEPNVHWLRVFMSSLVAGIC